MPRAAISQHRGRRALFLLIALVTVGLAAAWSFVAYRQLDTSIVRANDELLDHGRKAFELTRSRTQDALRAQCRVMAEDPRLKATLATQGVDEATVADILRDLLALRGSGFIVVLDGNGRVFAEAGADELKNLDLSASSVVKRAQSANEATAGSWLIGGKLIDLGAMTIRVDGAIVAYLVVGQPVDQALVKAVADATGVQLAVAVGQELPASSITDPRMKALLVGFARDTAINHPRALAHDGAAYLVMTADLEDTAQAHPRLVVVRELAPSRTAVDLLVWLLFVPPVLVLVGLVLARRIG